MYGSKKKEKKNSCKKKSSNTNDKKKLELIIVYGINHNLQNGNSRNHTSNWINIKRYKLPFGNEQVKIFNEFPMKSKYWLVVIEKKLWTQKW